MQIEVGKTYISRDGRELTIERSDGLSYYSDNIESGYGWHKNGRWLDETAESPLDLVKEKTVLEIKEGGYYKLRDGKVVGPMKRRDNDIYVWGTNDELPQVFSLWLKDGALGFGQEHEFDIVAEAEKPAIVEQIMPVRLSVVPGQYGIVNIGKDLDIFVSVSTYTADDLLKAAETFKQIAEFIR